MDTASKGKRVLLAGATGLIGGACLELMLADSRIESVSALVRRPIPESRNDGRLRVVMVDFNRLEASAHAFAVDAIVCALGTTIRQAGSKQEFSRVDYGYPLELARIGRTIGVRHFLLVSALGADSSSSVFYNRVKGEVESEIAALDYPALTIVRPSLLLGEREARRIGESLAKPFMRLMPAAIRAIPARAVAAALAHAVINPPHGKNVISNAQLHRYVPVSVPDGRRT